MRNSVCFAIRIYSIYRTNIPAFPISNLSGGMPADYHCTCALYRKYTGRTQPDAAISERGRGECRANTGQGGKKRKARLPENAVTQKLFINERSGL